MENNIKPFDIVCLNKQFKYTKEKFRAYNPYFYISLHEPDGYYSYNDIFISELFDVDSDGEIPVMGIYNPLKDRFVVATLWWYNDTYRGVLDMCGSRQQEWIYLKVDYNSTIANHNYHEFEIDGKILPLNLNHKNRDVFYKLDDESIALVDELYNITDGEDEKSKKLKILLAKLKVQRIS